MTGRWRLHSRHLKDALEDEGSERKTRMRRVPSHPGRWEGVELVDSSEARWILFAPASPNLFEVTMKPRCLLLLASVLLLTSACAEQVVAPVTEDALPRADPLSAKSIASLSKGC